MDHIWRLVARQSSQQQWGQPESGGDVFLDLISNPFQSQVQQNSFLAAIIWAFLGSLAMFITFCILRPRTNAVYAPRAKYADEKHAPPRLGKGLFSWFTAVKTKETDLVDKIGLDAVVFLRFIKMLRNVFLIMTPIGLGLLIPINVLGSHDYGGQWAANPAKRQTATNAETYKQIAGFMKMTPQYIQGSKFWAFVICAYLFTGVFLFFLWWEYRAVLRLRRYYFESSDYRSSLHSRSLLISHIPESMRTDERIAQLVQEAKPCRDAPRTAVARNVKELPSMIEEYEEAVKKLEKFLATYLKNPNSLPSSRPMCKPSKKDKAFHGDYKVDAIDYYTGRIRQLEAEIKEVRQTVDQRYPMSYGFASYTYVQDAHAVAYATRKKGPQGTNVRLAPKPSDLIWKNLAMTRAQRRSRSLWNGFWVVVLTLLYIVPNILTAVFLSDLSHLARVWSGFRSTYNAHPVWWSIVQGILAPAIQAAFYLILPTIFRRLFHNAGDYSKTSRERHVCSRLFSFLVFNKLIVFCLFSVIWKFITEVVHAKNEGFFDRLKDGKFLTNLIFGLCNVSPFMITQQTQSNLSAAIDLLQLLPLLWGSLRRHTGNPTPRDLIELTAPPPVLYAEFYANYLFILAAGFSFATLQPLILLFTAIYLTIEYWYKKYLVQYVLITKTESGGTFWRMVFNRVLFCVLLGDVVVGLLVAANGHSLVMGIVMIPLVPIIFGFKWYCAATFDNKLTYYNTKTYSDTENFQGGEPKAAGVKRSDRVAVRFGNPALYKKLMTPMVSAKSQHLLKQVYAGRVEAEDPFSAAGYSDVYMTNMSSGKPGKAAAPAPFEVVSDADLDFENFKRRAEFREEFGGDGELYGRPDDMSRPTTPGSFATMVGSEGHYRKTSDSPSSSRASSRTRFDQVEGTTYAKGYHMTPSDGFRGASPDGGVRRKPVGGAPRMDSMDVTAGHPAFRDSSRDRSESRGRGQSRDDGYLLTRAASMGADSMMAATPGYEHVPPHRVGTGGSYDINNGSLVGTPQYEDAEMSYDYFRRGRR